MSSYDLFHSPANYSDNIYVNSISIGVSGGASGAAGVTAHSSSLSNIEQFTFTSGITGHSATGFTGTFGVSVVGNLVNISMNNSFSAIFGATGHFSNITPLPSSIRPGGNLVIPVMVFDNSVSEFGCVNIATTGIMTWYDGVSGTGFPPALLGGVAPFGISYNIY